MPEICALYPLDVPPALLRAKIRTKFERYRHVTDVAVIDILLHKGHTEYQETMNAWKQVPHVMQWFRDEEAPGTYGPLTMQPNPRRSWASFMLRVMRVVVPRTRVSSYVGNTCWLE